MRNGNKLATSKDLIDRFCEFLEDDGRSRVTVMNYRYDIEALMRWSHSRNPKGLNFRYFVVNILQPYRESLVREFKPATANRKIATLKVFLHWACFND